jgi:phage/plasmid-like protein (TIGR03299 family)
MTANIFGDRFYGYREPAWHGLGQVSETLQTAEEAHAAMLGERDFMIHKRPLAYRGADETFRLIDGRVALVRDVTVDDPEERVFGVVDAEYGLLQNKDIIEAINPLSERWPVETYGFLGYGETLFLTLDAGVRELRGEPLSLFFLITDGRTGRDAMRIAFTPVRVVCQNTLVTGLRASVVSAALNHTRGVKRDLDVQMRVMAAMEKAEMDVLAQFEALMDAHISPEEANALFEQVYPMPQRPGRLMLGDAVREVADAPTIARLDEIQHQYDLMMGRVRERREAVGGLFARLNDEHPQVAMTPWAAYNAVVELEDYRRFSGSQERAAESSLFGERAANKATAFQLASDLIN